MAILKIDEAIRDKIIEILIHPSDAVPTDEEIKEACGQGTDALTAKWRLRFLGYKEKNIELAIQRACDRGVIERASDWKLKAT